MSAKIQVKMGPLEETYMCTPLLTIGRTAPNDIVVPNPKISRNHAMIRMLRHDEYYLIDVGSTNGTYLNGKRVVMPMLLKDMDVITLEDCTMTFCSVLDVAAASSAEDDEDLALTRTSMGIEAEEITLLVCDIRNYTPISESMPPCELAALMSEWFKLATNVIDACCGTIDKFIGDAIMVRWSSGIDGRDHSSVINALRAAQRLHEICKKVNASYPNLSYPFKVGVGINSGRAILGSIGGSGYREYTAIGDSVNMAFRFESESKALGKDVVMGPDSYRHLPEPLWKRSLQTVTVKGKSEPIAVWALTFGEIEGVLAAASS